MDGAEGEMMRLVLLLLLLLPSCSVIRQAEEAVEKANRILNSVEAEKSAIDGVLDKLAQGAAQLGEQGTVVLEKIEAARGVVAAADKNQDGTIAGVEWWKLLVGLAGLFGLGKGGQAVVQLSKDRAQHRSETEAVKRELAELKKVA